MALICWNVWRWRCEELFEKKRPSLAQKLELIKLHILEMERAFDISPIHQRREENNVVLGEV